MEGWIKIWRQLLEWQWFSSPNHLVVFMNILLRANFRETNWRGEALLPGQLLTGRKKMSEWTGLTEMQIRRVLADLEKTGEITIKKTNKFSVISITNWEVYQSEEPTKNQQITNKQPHPKNAKNSKKNTYSNFSNSTVVANEVANLIRIHNSKEAILTHASDSAKKVFSKYSKTTLGSADKYQLDQFVREALKEGA